MRYRLLDLLVDLETRNVRRDCDAIRLPDLSFRVLARLIRGAPGPVSNGALAHDAWGMAHVTDETISQRIALLRRALGDDPKSPRYIRTVRGAGYAIASPVESLSDECHPSFGRRSWMSAIAAAAFVALAALTGSMVMQRHTDNESRMVSHPLPPAGDILVRRARDHLGLHQASETERAIAMLREALALDPDARGGRLALSFALSTRATKFRATNGDRAEAESLARTLVGINDKDSGAWHALGYALDAQGRVDEAVAAYQRAYRLDPADAAAMSSAAYLLAIRGRLFDALALEARGLAGGQPSLYAETQIAWALELLDHPAAQQWRKRARTLNPGQIVVLVEAAGARLRRADPEGALEILAESSESDRASPRLLRVSGRAHLMRGEIDAAHDAFLAAGEMAAFDLAAMDAIYGKATDSQGLLQSAAADMIAGSSWPGFRVQMAELAAASGDDGAALQLLSQAIDLGWRDADLIATSPFFSRILANPTWADLQRRINRELAAQRELVENAPELGFLLEIDDGRSIDGNSG